MADDSRVVDESRDAPPLYGNQVGDADDPVTVSMSTTPGEWLVNTVDAVVVPMSMAEVVEALHSHKLTEHSLVWRSGMQEWASVDKVPQLKLAARLPTTTAAGAAAPPSRPAPPRHAPPPTVATAVRTAPPPPRPRPSKPPPKPVRSSSPPPQVLITPLPPPAMPSRRNTLPFGLPAQPTSQPRPPNSRPSSARPALPPPSASSDEPEALAVYARPAATISFELSPATPLRASPTLPPASQSLAPTTTDNVERPAPSPRNADLSVVLASDFRHVKRSSQRLVLLSSLASAVLASLLTFALSRGGDNSAASAATPNDALAAASATPLAAAAKAAATPATSVEPTSAAPEAAPSASVASDDAKGHKSKAKPKPSARRARAPSAAIAARPARPDANALAGARDPASEPNPYAVKLEDDPPASQPAHGSAHGSGLEDTLAPQASSNGSSSPGF